MTDEFKCEFLDIPEHCVFPVTDETPLKSGRYHGSMFTVPGYGITTWVVGGYIKVDWQALLEQGLEEQTIIDLCLAHMNAPVVLPSGKIRKGNKNKYGMHFGMCVQHKFREKNGQRVIECLLTTDKHLSKHFWSEGILVSGGIAARGGRRKLEQNTDVESEVVDEQVIALVKENKPSSGRVCSKCGQPGHNSRTCKKN